MKTHELIQALSSDPKPHSRIASMNGFLSYWAVGVVCLFIAAFSYWTVRPDWSTRILNPQFAVETLLWFVVAFVGAVMAYRSAIPSMLKKPDMKWALIPVLAIAALWITKFHAANVPFTTEFHGEMNAFRGRCGALILAVGGLMGTGMFVWARKAAPTRLRVTGLWIALSSGSLGTFAMQAVCPYENPLHLWIWHVLPVVALAFAGSYLAEPLLRWRGERLEAHL